ncbi:alpha/beta fold hydrolase [Limnoglobus roseus]|uniref:Alpha/beta hydrolase n=1 Tax=Limnoglobus roseus TaxID=2598579 RepID=A0A5C1A622_9BACT|nr:alpha/beta hydrolase [Limnoglobus roseus]QEL13805.1 alpha/beta hydrolase [Limnoglobus roseus]
MNQMIEHRGCPLAYDVRGTGPRVLFIQGVGVHGGGWRPQIDGLADRYTCLSFDNRGMGRSQPAGADISVAQMADDALAVMDASGWASAHVVGHSLGGQVAVALALAVRDRVRSLSLLCTFANGRAVAPLTARMIWFGMRSQVGTRRMRRRGFLKLVLPPGPQRENADAMAERIGELFGHDLADQPPVVKQQLRAMRACDLTPRLPELAGLPTLVVSAVHDPIAPPRVGRGLLGIPGSRYVEFPDASHGLPITHAEQVNVLLHEQFAAAP